MSAEIVNREPADALRRRPRILRALLLVLGPVVVLAVGSYVYYTGGRYVETDNAYVKADIAVISPEVSGPIVRVDVHENQRMAAGDVLFAIDDRQLGTSEVQPPIHRRRNPLFGESRFNLLPYAR